MDSTKNKSRKKYKNANTPFFLILCIVMVIAISAVGVLLTVRSVSDLKKTVWNQMESVATAAATLVDGDELKLITIDDYPIIDEETGTRVTDGSERCAKIEQVLNKVREAQKGMYIPYIYITRLENGRQVFVVDPDIVSPAEYGEEVVYTPSQPIAWAGQATVDEEPYSDEWGTYYTAWSPVRDSAGRVVGLVGVDFEVSQITEEINDSLVFIISTTVVLLALSITFFLLYSSNVRRRAQQLGGEINDLSDSLRTMFDEIEGIEKTDKTAEPTDESSGQDFMKYVHNKTIDMTQRLRKHTAYMEQQANIDFMTKTYNTRAYSAEKDKHQAEIDSGAADFAVAIFDINNLKRVNDSYGHEMGDLLIKSAADVLKKTFASLKIYRIGGDEFTVVIPGATDKSIELEFGLMEYEIDRTNKALDAPVTLAVAKGYAIFDKATDKEFKDVFVRADQNMYIDKENYHITHMIEQN